MADCAYRRGQYADRPCGTEALEEWPRDATTGNLAVWLIHELVARLPLCYSHAVEIASELSTAERWRQEQLAEERAAAWERQQREREAQRVDRVYVIQRASDGMVKIGYSGSVERRLRDHRNQHGEIDVLLLLDAGRERERELHHRYAEYRVHGEWFQRGRRLDAWIRRQAREAEHEAP